MQTVDYKYSELDSSGSLVFLDKNTINVGYLGKKHYLCGL